MSAAILRLSHPQYRPDIDGLRAIAVLSVVAFHAFPGWMKGGFIGVDLFFVISGFLISSILFESLARDTFSFSAFYARRVRRIFPALLLVLAASYAIGWFVLFADEFRQLGGYMAAGAGFVGNLLAWSEAGYFDSAAEAKPLLHLWSLGVEEQFYIVWPLLLWLAWRARLQPLALLVGVVLASFGLNLDRVAEDSAAAFYSPLTRLWELACGGLLAWLVLHRRTAPLPGAVDGGGTALANLVSIGGCLVLAGSFWLIDKDSGFPGWWAVLPVLGSVLVILAGRKRVRIILDSPELDFAPRFCLRSRLDGCRIGRDVVVRRQAGYRAIIERIAAEHGIPVVDLMTAFCPGAHCHARLEGKILYRDTHHLGVWGTEFLRTTGFRLD